MNDFKNNIAEGFGNALREVRQKANLSQEALALECGVDRTFVSMMERGIRQPALSTVFALCTVLPISPGALVDRAAALMSKSRKKRSLTTDRK